MFAVPAVYTPVVGLEPSKAGSKPWVSVVCERYVQVRGAVLCTAPLQQCMCFLHWACAHGGHVQLRTRPECAAHTLSTGALGAHMKDGPNKPTNPPPPRL